MEVLFVPGQLGLDGRAVGLYLVQGYVPVLIVNQVFDVQRLRLGPLFAAELETIGNGNQVILFTWPSGDGIGFTRAQVKGVDKTYQWGGSLQ